MSDSSMHQVPNMVVNCIPDTVYNNTFKTTVENGRKRPLNEEEATTLAYLYDRAAKKPKVIAAPSNKEKALMKELEEMKGRLILLDEQLEAKEDEAKAHKETGLLITKKWNEACATLSFLVRFKEVKKILETESEAINKFKRDHIARNQSLENRSTQSTVPEATQSNDPEATQSTVSEVMENRSTQSTVPEATMISTIGTEATAAFDSVKTLKAHSGTVRCIAMLGPDRMVTGSYDTTMKIWNSNGTLLKILEGHDDCVSCLATLGERIVSGSWDSTVKIWKTDGTLLKTLRHGHHGFVTCVAILGDRIVSGSDDKTIKIWNMDGTLKQTFYSSAAVKSVAILDFGRFVSGSVDNVVKIWGKKGAKVLEGHRAWKGHSDIVSSVAILGPDRIVSGSYDKTVKIWSTNGKLLKTLKGHSDRVLSVAILGPDRIVSGSEDKTVKIWNTNGECLRTLEDHSDDVYSVATLGPDRIVSGSADKTLKIWNISGSDTTVPETTQSTVPEATQSNGPEATQSTVPEATQSTVPEEGEVVDVTAKCLEQERLENTIDLNNDNDRDETEESIEVHKAYFNTVISTDTWKDLKKGDRNTDRKRSEKHLEALKKLKDLLSTANQFQKDAFVQYMLQRHSSEENLAVYSELVIACGCHFQRQYPVNVGSMMNQYYLFDGADCDNNHGIDRTTCAWRYVSKKRVKSVITPRGSRGPRRNYAKCVNHWKKGMKFSMKVELGRWYTIQRKNKNLTLSGEWL